MRILQTACMLAISLIAFLPANAQQQKRLMYGVYAGGGANVFVSKYNYDNSFYHFPLTAQYGLGGQIRWSLTRIDHIFLEAAFDHNRTVFTAEKYNTNWATVLVNRYCLGLGFGYRMDFSRTSPFWFQTGFLFKYALNRDMFTVTTSQRSNAQHVREVLMAVYEGELQSIAASLQVKTGYYLNKKKTHELAFHVGIPINPLLKKSREGFMRQSFTFADGSSAIYETDFNGFVIPVSLQYGFWF